MADPVSSAVASAIVSGTVSQVWGRIMDADDPEATWMGSAETCVVKARVSYEQNYNRIDGVDRRSLKTDTGRIGESAKELQVRGDIQDFNSELVDLLDEFAEACGTFAQAPSTHGGGYLSEFGTQLDELGEEIIEVTQGS